MIGRIAWSCRRARGRLAQHLYGLLTSGQRRALERHLGACPVCSAEWEATRRAFGQVDSDTAFPFESQVDWQRFARDTVAKAWQAESAQNVGALPGSRGVRLRPLLAWGGPLAAVLIALAIVLPRLDRPISRPDAGPPAVSVESTRLLQRSLARQGAARYLRDSRSLLVSLIEAPVRCRRSDGAYDLSLERERSRQLLRKKNLYIGSLGGLADQRLADLVGQLEVLLLEISSFDDCTTARQIHDLRDAMERGQILMRIDLVTRSVEGGGPRV